MKANRQDYFVISVADVTIYKGSAPKIKGHTLIDTSIDLMVNDMGGFDKRIVFSIVDIEYLQKEVFGDVDKIVLETDYFDKKGNNLIGKVRITIDKYMIELKNPIIRVWTDPKDFIFEKIPIK